MEGGYAIVMYTGEMQAIVRSLDDAAGEIREQLAGQRMLQMRDELVAKLREEYKPEVKPELVDAIVLEPPGKADIPQGVPAAPRDPREPLKQVKPDKYLSTERRRA